MMRKWIVSALLMVLAIAVVVSASKFFQQHPQPVIVNQVEQKSGSPESVKVPAGVESRGSADIAAASEKPISPPVVNSKQLFAHVKALNFKRYTEAERDRTRTYLTQSLKKLGWSSQLQPFGVGVNVVATRLGTDPEAGTVLVGAHYDTVAISPGADDNASGVAVLLELARLFNSLPTPRTLQLVFFDQEESGLLGSLAFASNKANLADIRGVIVMDMVGYACYTKGCQRYPEGLPITPPNNLGNFLAVVGDSEHLPLLDAFQQIAQPGLPPVLKLPVPFKGMLTPDLLRSDHASFWYQGVGAVLVSDTANLRTPHYHQSSDTPANIDRAFFKGSAQIVVNAIATLLSSHKQLDS